MSYLTPKQKTEKLNKILDYIRLNYRRYKKYPALEFIEKKFHTNLRTYNLDIPKVYKLANVPYKRDPNPFLRYKKEKLLVEIAKKLFTKLGYKIKSTSFGPSKPNGADIIVEDKRKRIIPIEIKAYQKFGKIGQVENSPYIQNEILQLERYIKDLKAPYGYLITSTDRKTFKTVPSNIKILFAKDLKKMLIQFKMYKDLRNLDWIRNSTISYGKEKIYEKIREKILEYVEGKIKKGKYVSNDEVMDKFKLHVESYFPGGMREIYKKFNMDVELIPNYRMSRRFNKEKLKERIINFVKEEKKKGHLPTHKEIQRKFGCLVKLYFAGGIREIAKLVGIRYNRKFATKTLEERELIRQKIIKYAIKKLRIGFYPGYRDVESKFHINFQYYFKNPEELCQKAGYNSSVKKTWKNYQIKS